MKTQIKVEIEYAYDIGLGLYKAQLSVYIPVSEELDDRDEPTIHERYVNKRLEIFNETLHNYWGMYLDWRDPNCRVSNYTLSRSSFSKLKEDIALTIEQLTSSLARGDKMLPEKETIYLEV